MDGLTTQDLSLIIRGNVPVKIDRNTFVVIQKIPVLPMEWFWEALDGLTEGQKIRLVKFATGHEEVVSINIWIEKHDGDETDITADTGTRTFMIPKYSSKEILKERLIKVCQ